MTVSWFLNRQPQQPGEQGGEQAASQAAQAGELASRWIGQRRYLAHLPYVLPRDAPEAHRLDFQHFYLRALLKGLHLVPLPAHRLHEVLDVGCGTGRWVHEMALAYPHAQVCGLDIEAPPPVAHPLASNALFVQGNLLHPLPFPDESFDLVHQRLLVAAIPTSCWPQVIAELARVTRPGGWIELVESNDAYLNAGPHLQRVLAWGRAVCGTRGIEVSRVACLDELLRGVGLSQVERHVLHAPLGRWGGRLGYALAQNTLAAFEGLRGLACQTVPLAPEHFDATLALLAEEWNAYQTSCPFYLFHARKPDQRGTRQGEHAREAVVREYALCL